MHVFFLFAFSQTFTLRTPGFWSFSSWGSVYNTWAAAPQQSLNTKALQPMKLKRTVVTIVRDDNMTTELQARSSTIVGRLMSRCNWPASSSDSMSYTTLYKGFSHLADSWASTLQKTCSLHCHWLLSLFFADLRHHPLLSDRWFPTWIDLIVVYNILLAAEPHIAPLFSTQLATCTCSLW